MGHDYQILKSPLLIGWICPCGRGEVRTPHGYRPSLEEICNVEHAALTILFQGQASPTKKAEKSRFCLAVLDFKKTSTSKANRNFKTWLQKIQVGNPATSIVTRGVEGAPFFARRISFGAPKNLNNVASTFFNNTFASG